jgi:hypothetical protein
MHDTHIQLLIEDPSEAVEFSLFLSAAGYDVGHQDLSTTRLLPNVLLTVVADAIHDHTHMIDNVLDILTRNPRSVVIFRMPRNPAAPVWGDQFDLRAGYVTKGCSQEEFLSYLAEFIRVSKQRFAI